MVSAQPTRILLRIQVANSTQQWCICNAVEEPAPPPRFAHHNGRDEIDSRRIGGQLIYARQVLLTWQCPMARLANRSLPPYEPRHTPIVEYLCCNRSGLSITAPGVAQRMQNPTYLPIITEL